MKYFPRRDTLSEKLKAELAPSTPGFNTLCPTRWIVRATSLSSVLTNYDVFQGLWEEAQDVANDCDVRARVIGVQATITNFEYMLGECILSHTDKYCSKSQINIIRGSIHC